MNIRQNYQSLVDQYRSGHLVVKKLGIVDLFIQIGSMGVIHSWKHVGLGYYHIAVPILFFFSICYLVKDFFTLHKLEDNLAKIILTGIDLEVTNPALGNFFHGVLRAFNFTSLLVQRSLVAVLSLGCFGYLMLQFLKDINPGIAINQWFLLALTWILGLMTSKLYYDSFKDLDERKELIFSRQS